LPLLALVVKNCTTKFQYSEKFFKLRNVYKIKAIKISSTLCIFRYCQKSGQNFAVETTYVHKEKQSEQKSYLDIRIPKTGGPGANYLAGGLSPCPTPVVADQQVACSSRVPLKYKEALHVPASPI